MKWLFIYNFFYPNTLPSNYFLYNTFCYTDTIKSLNGKIYKELDHNYWFAHYLSENSDVTTDPITDMLHYKRDIESRRSINGETFTLIHGEEIYKPPDKMGIRLVQWVSKKSDVLYFSRPDRPNLSLMSSRVYYSTVFIDVDTKNNYSVAFNLAQCRIPTFCFYSYIKFILPSEVITITNRRFECILFFYCLSVHFLRVCMRLYV